MVTSGDKNRNEAEKILSEEKGKSVSGVEKINEEMIPLDEGKRVHIAQYNSVPNNLRYSVGGGVSQKEGVEFTFKKQDGIEESIGTLQPSQRGSDKRNNENIPTVSPFEDVDDDNVMVSEEFKESEQSVDYDCQSSVSSYIGSRLNKSIIKKQTSGTLTGTENSFCSDNRSMILDTQHLITENFLQKITSRTLLEDEYDINITNENSEGFGKFIETPKTGNVNLGNTMPFPRSKNSSLSVS
jgi:hypothetical protein